MRSLLVAFALTALAVAPGPVRADVADITGSWTVTGSCKGVLQGAKAKLTFTGTIEYSEDASAGTAASQVALTTNLGPIDLDFCGDLIGVPGKSDQVAGLFAAGSGPAFASESLTNAEVFPADSSGATGKLKGSLTVVDQGNQELLTCKFKGSRTSTSDPGVSCGSPT